MVKLVFDKLTLTTKSTVEVRKLPQNREERKYTLPTLTMDYSQKCKRSSRSIF